MSAESDAAFERYKDAKAETNRLIEVLRETVEAA
jgi:hypothetical protein